MQISKCCRTLLSTLNWTGSAYEGKNNCCLFERLFKVKKTGVFLFGISFFVLEIFTFLYYANEKIDDVIGGFTKTVQHLIEEYLQTYWSSVLQT